MADEKQSTEKLTTHVGVETRTQKMIAILARVQPSKTTMRDLVRDWADDAWQDAKQAGLVTDAMLFVRAEPTMSAVAAETVKG